MRDMSVKVVYARHPFYLLGPIGIPKVGETYELKGKRLEVTNTDADGLMFAWDAEHLAGLEDKERERIKGMCHTVSHLEGPHVTRYREGQTRRNRELAAQTLP